MHVRRALPALRPRAPCQARCFSTIAHNRTPRPIGRYEYMPPKRLVLIYFLGINSPGTSRYTDPTRSPAPLRGATAPCSTPPVCATIIPIPNHDFLIPPQMPACPGPASHPPPTLISPFLESKHFSPFAFSSSSGFYLENIPLFFLTDNDDVFCCAFLAPLFLRFPPLHSMSLPSLNVQ